MIATVTLNPSLDEHINVNGLIVEESNRWHSLERYAGGKGIDVSRAIHEMDGATTAYGFIGGPNGRMVEIMLDEEGVPYSFTPIAAETRTNFIITDLRNGEQTRIGAPGPAISPRELVRFWNKLRRINPLPNLLAVGGSVPPGVPADVYYTVVNEAKAMGVRTILDSAGHWLREGMKACPFLIKPNVHEAEGLLARDIIDEADIINAALDLVEMGIEIAVISCGKNGLIAATSERLVKAVPPAVEVVSAVGAGDCTIAGLALKLERSEPLIEACRLAAAMGTAAVITPGTELCHRRDVERLLPQVVVNELPASRGLTAIPVGS